MRSIADSQRTARRCTFGVPLEIVAHQALADAEVRDRDAVGADFLQYVLQDDRARQDDLRALGIQPAERRALAFAHAGQLSRESLQAVERKLVAVHVRD